MMKMIEYNVEKLHNVKPLIVLTGPTAVGKTATSIGFAKSIGGEIISADSMQVYRGMDIGSAKITSSEMDGIPHHLIDILNPEEEFNVLLFQKYGKQAIEEIYNHGHIPIITGGTGFYIQSIVYNIDFTTEENPDIRIALEKEAEKFGPEKLHQKLEQVDPKSAELIHFNNVKRVIRALEFYELNGYPLSEHNETEHAKKSPYLFRYYVLNDDRKLLYERIDERVDQMFLDGLLDEVKKLQEKGYTRDMVSMQGLGYKEVLDYLNGMYSLEDAIAIIKRDTRHFAKRQLTWFRREKEVIWIDKMEFGRDALRITNHLINDFEKTIKPYII